MIIQGIIKSSQLRKSLLVDDHADVATTFKAILQKVGLVVDTYDDRIFARLSMEIDESDRVC